MQHQGSWMGNRVVIAIVGALLIGGISAAIAWGGAPLHPPATAGAQNGGNSSTGVTATPAGQTVTVSGIIQRVDPLNDTFSILEDDNSMQQVDITSATQFTGDAASFADLQSGEQATASGTLQPDGSLSAATVNVSSG
jgi:TolA-binding protein